MPEQPDNPKPLLRREAKARLAALTEAQRSALSASAARILTEAPVFTSARSVMLYVSTPEEVDTAPIIAAATGAGKRVCVPRMDWAARSMIPVVIDREAFPTEVRRHGIGEPVGGFAATPSSLDLVVVPGLAFDARGRRIGRGAGYYDRFLAEYRQRRGDRAAVVGLCFECQIFPEVPAETHDAAVDALATETRLINCR